MIHLQFPQQEHGVLSHLNTMRLQSQLCDVSVLAGGQKFHCHQAVLAASSGHFHGIFVQGVLCFPKRPTIETLDLSFISAEVFSVVLDYIYTANLHCPTGIIADVLQAAKTLEIEPLARQLPVFVGTTPISSLNGAPSLSVETPPPSSEIPSVVSASEMTMSSVVSTSGMTVPESLVEMLTEPEENGDQAAGQSAMGDVVVKQELLDPLDASHDAWSSPSTSLPPIPHLPLDNREGEDTEMASWTAWVNDEYSRRLGAEKIAELEQNCRRCARKDNSVRWYIRTLKGVDELRYISTLLVSPSKNQLQCDCKLREIKIWLLENKHLRWHVSCMVGATEKDIRYVDLKDLRCTSPDVSITLDNGTATGNVSFTCRTDCQEGLAFAWITPSGDYMPPSYQYSMNYTHERKSSCKGSPVTSWETRLMCYSVLNIPGVGSDADGTYTCQVTADHTDNASVSALLTVSSGTEKSTRAYSPEIASTFVAVTPPAVDKGVEKEAANWPGIELSTGQLILAGLGSFCGCSVIVGVITACVGRCKADSHMERSNRERDDAVDGHPDPDDQSSDDARRGQYENEDQFSDTTGASGGHYENNDEFSDREGARGGHYENDDQFSDTDGAKGGHYENEDQFSDTEGAKRQHHENDDQFSGGDVSKHSHKIATGKPTGGSPGNASSTARAKRMTCHRIKRGLVKTRAVSNNKTVSSIIDIAIHAEAQVSGHYDNETKTFGRNLRDSNAKPASADNESDSKNQTAGHYDNDKNAKCSAPNTTIKSPPDADSDSDHDYMPLPGNEAAGQGTGLGFGEGKSKARDDGPVSTSASAAETENANDDSNHTSVTLPGTENANDDSDHAYMTLPGTESANDNSGHTVAMHPETEHSRPVGHIAVSSTSPHHGRQVLKTCGYGNRIICLWIFESDHTSVTLPGTENDDDDSDHAYMTFPDSENAEEQQMETEQKDGQVLNPVTGLSDEDDNSDHVTSPERDNAGKQQEETNVEKSIDVTIPDRRNAQEEQQWCLSRNKSPDFETLPPDQLSRLLQQFYYELRNPSGGRYGGHTMLGFRSTIKTYLLNHPAKPTFDITHDSMFSAANKTLLKVVKKCPIGFEVGIKAISFPDLQKLFDSGTLGTSTPNSLQRLIWFYFTVHFHIKTTNEWLMLKKKDLTLHNQGRKDAFFTLRRPVKGGQQIEDRMYATGGPLCPVAVTKLYLKRLNTLCNSLLQKPVRGRLARSGRWFKEHPPGQNYLVYMMKGISIDAGLSLTYTNNRIRSTTRQDLVRAGIFQTLVASGAGGNHALGASTLLHTLGQSLDMATPTSQQVVGMPGSPIQSHSLPGGFAEDASGQQAHVIIKQAIELHENLSDNDGDWRPSHFNPVSEIKEQPRKGVRRSTRKRMLGILLEDANDDDDGRLPE
ncbi:ZBTB7A [Branchiostoma lanceolatum]|uniref:ZBTB7A protein n=1 Tax=Branchiostoma lanceolatum TaxID=7740 RepID=A0A8K0ES71_BRALA|nr:ZBTB7A [Branchiostoma lanceolatum]